MKEREEQEQYEREQKFVSGNIFVGQWGFKSGSDKLNVVKTGTGTLLLSRTDYSGQQIWTVPGRVENFLLVFEGESKGKKVSGRLRYRQVSIIEQELSGELIENGELSPLIVDKIE